MSDMDMLKRTPAERSIRLQLVLCAKAAGMNSGEAEMATDEQLNSFLICKIFRELLDNTLEITGS